MYATATSERYEARARPPRGLLAIAYLSVSMLLGAATEAAVDPAAQVDVQIVARPAGAGAAQEFQLRDGGVLRTGDGVQLRLSSDTQAYVYVIAYGSSQSALLLHPFSGRAQDALVKPGATHIVPEPGVFLPLDGQEGREALFSIVSQVPLDDVTDLLARMERHGEDLNAITALIGERYPDVRRLTFRHIGVRPLVGVAAVAPRSASSSALPAGTEARRSDDAEPSAGGGWSLPSASGSFDAGDTTGRRAAPAAPAGSVASAAAAPKAARDATAGEPASASAAAAEDRSHEDVSPALRRAREAAGIDEQQFRGILATLPSSGVPEAIAERHKEAGVLSAEGSRIRALDSVQVESGAGVPAPAGSSADRTRN